MDLELGRLLLNPKRFLNPKRTFSPGSLGALGMRWADFFRNRGMPNELLFCVVKLIKCWYVVMRGLSGEGRWVALWDVVEWLCAKITENRLPGEKYT